MSRLFKFFSKKDIRSASIGGVSVKFGSTIFALLNSVLLARLLSLEGFGYYVLVIATVMLLAVPVNLGMPFLVTRYVSKYLVYDDYASIKGLLIKTNKMAGMVVILIYFIAAISYFIWWKNLSPVLIESMLYGFLLLPFLGFGALRTSALRGMKLIVLADLPETLLRNGGIFITLVIVYFLGIPITPKSAVLINLIVSAVCFGIGYLFLRNKLLLKLKPIAPSYHSKEWFQQTIPFTINSSIVIVKSKVLTYILAIFGSVEAVAIFDVAMRGSTLVSFILDALNQAISPFVSSTFEKNNKEALQRIMKKTSRIIFSISLLVALIFVLGGKTVLIFVFGAEYVLSYWPLVILCIGQLVSATIGSVGLLLSMSGNQAVFSKNNIVFLVINLVLSIPFVIYFDVLGAAVLYSLILIIQNIILFVYVRRKLKINTTIF